VFIAETGGFRAQPVTPGRSGAGYTQIIQGLKGGERIAGRGAFVLKAELSKGEAGHEE
jgi:cobalt-zinc-cadmium efflux system membrane fusion protein